MKAVVVLHIFVTERNSCNFEYTLTVVGMNDLQAQPNMKGEKGSNDIRNILSDNFLTKVG